MKKAFIKRLSHGEKQTLGELFIRDGDDEVFTCKTLELPWLDNKVQVSCIPAGSYKVKKRNSAKYGDHFHIEDVPGRTFILIHHGNYYTDILGCVLVGTSHTDINNDGLRDVTASRTTMAKLNQIMPDEFEIEIESPV